jgi:serine/threonine-protein kinase RsbW
MPNQAFPKTLIWHVSCLTSGMRQNAYNSDAYENYPVAIPATHHAGPFVELQQSMPSRLNAISTFVDQIMSFVTSLRIGDGSEIEIALREALANAVTHGNRNDPSNRVHVVCRCGIDGEVFITVRDEGEGFDLTAVPDPTAPENRLSVHGRGIYLMRAFMDKVQFEEGGTVVQMRKEPPQEPCD